MEWTRSETLVLANNRCTTCHGMGLRHGRGDSMVPCNCVFRCIFRVCFDKFFYCAFKSARAASAKLEYNPTLASRTVYGRKDEEYIADFCLASRRMLTDADHRIFRYHFRLGADWRICCRALKMERGAFFHAVYRIQQRLGRAFREMRPYGLFPLDEYFHGTMRNEMHALDEPVVSAPRKSLSDAVPIAKKAA
jgi:hypothetical protein